MTETKKRATGKRVSGALIKNAVLLTVFSLACKGIGMLFRLYLSVRIGAEGMGLYQLVMSVYTLFSAPTGCSTAPSGCRCSSRWRPPD